MNYGRVLKEARQQAGYNQSQFAEKLHLGQSDVSKIETDKKEAPFSLIVKWAQLTGSQEAIAALVCGADVASILADMFTTTLNVICFLL